MVFHSCETHLSEDSCCVFVVTVVAWSGPERYQPSADMCGTLQEQKMDHGALLGAALRGIHQQPLWLQPLGWHRCVTWIQWGYRLVELSNDIYIYNPHLYLYLYRCHNTMFRHIDHCLPAIGWGWFWRMSQDISWSWKMRAKKRWRAAWNDWMWSQPHKKLWIFRD